MSLRLPYPKLAPQPYAAFLQASTAMHAASIGPRLVELVFMRVSQLNGCAFCIDMHWTALIGMGEDPRRLNALAGWHEAGLFDERDCAALAWAEVLNDIGHSRASDDAFAAVRLQFNDTEVAELTFAAALMNAWNRVAIGMRQPLPKKS